MQVVMVWFCLKKFLQKFSTTLTYLNQFDFHPVNVSFLLTMTVIAGASNPSVSHHLAPGSIEKVQIMSTGGPVLRSFFE